MTALPPEPREPPVVQTLRWLLRPISFMESCRRRFGRRLASELRVNGHGLPPGTDVTPAI